MDHLPTDAFLIRHREDGGITEQYISKIFLRTASCSCPKALKGGLCYHLKAIGGGEKALYISAYCHIHEEREPFYLSDIIQAVDPRTGKVIDLREFPKIAREKSKAEAIKRHLERGAKQKEAALRRKEKKLRKKKPPIILA